MPSEKNLSDYYQVITPQDLLVGYEDTGKSTKKNVNSKVENLCMDLIVNSEGGAYSILDIIKKINDFGDDEEVKKTISLYGTTINEEKEYAKNISELLKTPKENNQISDVGIIFSHSPFVSTNVRNVNQTSLFLNVIPTLELSRAVPFMEIKFRFKRSPYGEISRKVQVPSLIKFLEGAIKIEDGSITQKMLDSQRFSKEDENVSGTEVDMGIFMSPQTLVNKGLGNSSDNSLVSTKIIDKFRPLASIGDVTIDVVASPSYEVAYKTLKMNMILYDRSRLSELADLIRPNAYAGTEMIIKYGWNHPDKSGKNHYANLINKMQLEERYGVTNSSYTMTETGQVKFELLFHMLGHIQLWISRTSENPDYLNATTQYNILKEEVSSLMTALGFEGDKEIRAKTIIQKIDDSINSKDAAEVKKEISKFISDLKKNNKGNPDVDKLIEVFQNKLDPTKKGSTTTNLKSTLDSVLKSKKDAILTNTDPFLDENLKTTDKKRKIENVSLAKIFSLYVIDPIRSSKKFSEVQVIFYHFNDYCGGVSGKNIGKFPVNLTKFQTIYTNFLKSKNTLDITCAEFCKSIIKDAIVSDPSSEAYGMKKYYDESGKIKKDQEKNLESARDKALSDAGKEPGASWKQPTLEFYVECLSKKDIKENDIEKTGNSSILRIHVYDKQATGWEPFIQLKKAQKAINSEKITDGAKTDLYSWWNKIKEKFPAEAEAEIFERGENNTMQVKMNPVKIKKFISSFVPTLLFGTNNSSIKSVSVQSIQNPMLNTVNMQRTTWATTTSPAGSSITGLPLTVTPGNISMNVIGCPLLHLNQQYFIDFETNTTLDNLYTLTGITHTIGQGKFESSLKFMWSDAWGTYENLGATTANMIEKLQKLKK